MDPHYGQYRPGKGSKDSDPRPPFPPYSFPPFPYGLAGPPPVHSTQPLGFPSNSNFPPNRPGPAPGNHFQAVPPFFPPHFPPPFPIPPPGHPGAPPGFVQNSAVAPSLKYLDLQRALNLKDSELNDVKVLLNRVLERCNQSDMALAKKWIVEHCKTSNVLRHLFKDFREAASHIQGEAPLRALYLANDLLFHDKRFQDGWVQAGLQPHLPFLVRFAARPYSIAKPGANDPLRKLLDIWDSQNCLKSEEIHILRELVANAEATPPPFMPPSVPMHPHGFPTLPFPIPPGPPPGIRPMVNHLPFNLPRPPIAPVVPYHKVPAGVMVLLCENSTSYSPIPIRSAQTVPLLPPSASFDLKDVIDDFYDNLEDSEKIDSNGWQIGYLDSWCDSRKEKLLQLKSPERSISRSSSRGRSIKSRSRSSNYSRSRSSSRYRSSRSSSRSRSRYRSRSRSRSASRSPSRSRRRVSSRHSSPAKRFYH